MKVLLQRAAHCRSGDKGNTSNISVIAYAPELYPYLKEQLTTDRFKTHYTGTGVVTGKVTRYDVDGLQALNFVAEGALGGRRFAQPVPRQLRQVAVGQSALF